MVQPYIRLFKFTLVLIALGLIGVIATHSSETASIGAQTPSREGIEFFEKKIRPVLVANCYQCHSAQAKKPQGGLLLDSRESLLKGGMSGQPAVVPGDPDKSLLIRAIRYADPKLQMPLGGKLPDRVIQDFEEWVKMGAPDPRAGEVAPAVASQPYDFEDSKKFWAFGPVKDRQPPQVKNEAWVKTPIDLHPGPVGREETEAGRRRRPPHTDPTCDLRFDRPAAISARSRRFYQRLVAERF
jgi:hypothetical protein